MTYLSTLANIGADLRRAIGQSVGGVIRDKRIHDSLKGHPAAVPGTLPWVWSDKPTRIALVNLLLQGRVLGDYLEIGCDRNDLFHSVAAARKVGVDPARGGTHRMTSDAFFAQNRQRFDVIWVDGLHTYDQVRRDVVHAIGALAPNGWVGIHDLLPRNWVEAYSPRLFPDGAWSGDVWKVAYELAASPDIDFKIVDIDRGVGVFRLRTADATLTDRRAELEPATFAFLRDRIGELPVVQWDEAFAWIADAKRAMGDLPSNVTSA